LGEIEAALRLHPLVKDAVVLCHPETGDDRRLVAYVSCPGRAVTPSDLRTHLESRLPDYMVPAATAILEALPLTVNGKVDRRSLPDVEAAGSQSDRPFEPPHNSIQRVVAGVWQSVLGVDRVGIHDNFFDLGGHSLMVARVHRRLSDLLDRELSVVDIFRYPTVSALAAFLTNADGAGAHMPTTHGKAEKQRASRASRLAASKLRRVPR
jgi:hypothetical protein